MLVIVGVQCSTDVHCNCTDVLWSTDVSGNCRVSGECQRRGYCRVSDDDHKLWFLLRVGWGHVF